VLAELNDPRCVELLVEVAQERKLEREGNPTVPGSSVRGLLPLRAARKLVDLGHPHAGNVLARMVEDSLYWREAVFELASLEDPRAIEPLVAWVNGEDYRGRATPSTVGARDAKQASRDVQSRAAEALVALGRSAIDPVKAAIRSRKQINTRALRVLAELGDPRAMQELQELRAAEKAAQEMAQIRTGALGRPLGGGGTCDLCGAAIAVGGIRLSADEMRWAVRAGLRPRGAAANIGATLGVGDTTGWFDMVMRDTTDWALCADCGSAARAL
jgi:hypothetical protein